MVKNSILSILRAFVIVLLCSTIGFVALLGTFSITSERIEKNLINSSDVFEEEGQYPALHTLSGTRELDYYTDALMLLNAGYTTNDKDLIERTLNVYRPVYISEKHVTPLITLYRLKNDETATFKAKAYSRYWHGYAIFLRPALFFADYSTIRTINSITVVLVIALVCYLFYIKLRKFLIPFILSLIIISPTAIAYCMQYSTVFYLFSFGIVIVLCSEKIRKSKALLEAFFVILGCATSYFDYLTYPIATLALPLIVYLCLESTNDWKRDIKLVITLSLCWGFGYAGMWIIKWILTALLINKNICKFVIDSILKRTGQTENNYFSTLIWAYIKNFGYLLLNPAIIPIGIYTVYEFKSILSLKNKKECFASMLPFLLIAVFPIAWYFVTCEHVNVHSVFTYRALIASVFAILCMLVKVKDSNKINSSKNIL